jgi:hypothetical protein
MILQRQLSSGGFELDRLRSRGDKRSGISGQAELLL